MRRLKRCAASLGIALALVPLTTGIANAAPRTNAAQQQVCIVLTLFGVGYPICL